MSFFSVFNRRKNIKKTREANDIKKKVKAFISKAVGFLPGNYPAYINNRPEYECSEYDFNEIDRACDTDSYISESISHYSRLIFKAGYELDGKDENVKYIRNRFKMMSISTGKPVDVLFSEIADDMYKYSNCFLIKSREEMIPGIKAKPYNKRGTVVSGYYRVDPASIRIKRTVNGKILSYKQVMNGKEKTLNKEDVVHMYIDKKSNYFGRPWIIPALDDVRVLRRVEGNVLGIIYRFFYPIYHYIVGLPSASASKPEVDEALKTVNESSLEGVFVTNERTEIKTIDNKSGTIDATGYLEYFQKRVFTALRVSDSIMGRSGTAKQDADAMESQAHDIVKSIQLSLSSFLTNLILNDLLLESGKNPITNDDDEVKFLFNEISLETKIKKENHSMLKYSSGIATLTETRRQMGMSEDVDKNDLFINAGQGDGNTQDDISNRNVPANQHGKTSVKVKEDI